MFHITDRTLSCLDRFEASGEALRDFAQMLVEAGIDRIEISQKAYQLMGELPEGARYVLRLDGEAEAAAFEEADDFICSDVHAGARSDVCTEVSVENGWELCGPEHREEQGPIRICGMGNALLSDYSDTFTRLSTSFGSRLELCPTNEYFCATAIGVEWILSGGQRLVTSFGGMGGFAATEEVLMQTKVQQLQNKDRSYPEFQRMRSALEEITGSTFARNKPVLGRDIFVVESGIHVDGIAKLPRCYEPFAPEAVGLERTFTLSKQSGMASVRVKLDELRLFVEHQHVPRLLHAVRDKSIEDNRSVSDEEFMDLAREIAASA